MGAAMVSLFTTLQGEASAPARVIATVVMILIGITLSLMPWEHGAVKFLKDSALRVFVGLAIVINAPAIIASI
jgi:uncharacterized membrane protein